MADSTIKRMGKHADSLFFGSVLLILAIGVNTCASANNYNAHKSQNRLILFQGFILNAYYDGKYILIKRLDPKSQSFYGYGFLDENNVFIAYQDKKTSAALARIEVVNMKSMKTTKLKSIGDVGESFFDVNTQTGNVVYSDEDAVRILKFNSSKTAYSIVNVKNGIFCWAAFWIENKTIGCKIVDDEEKFIKLTIPN